jgi:hypothetical protein
MSADRHEPLDSGERELARIVRALPAAEPPPGLDARILAMARDAAPGTRSAAAAPAPHCRPRLAWGLGVAVSGLLATGLVWRLGGFGPSAVEEAGPPAAMSAPSAPPPPAERRERAMPTPPTPPAARAMASAEAVADLAPAPVHARPTGIDRYRAEDGKAGAQAWLQRIRARIAEGDREGARASLEAFIASHPETPLPPDLDDFRRGDARS